MAQLKKLSLKIEKGLKGEGNEDNNDDDDDNSEGGGLNIDEAVIIKHMKGS